MKQFLFILCYIFGTFVYAQKEFHVFPNSAQTPGTKTGDGSLNNPWDLQTALNQKTDVVKSGDTIWLHEGIYNGRFKSTLKSLEPNQYITVSGFKDDKVVLNGNVRVEQTSVLQVRSQQVVFKNFEVTWLGDFSRSVKDDDFELCFGIEHLNGENCRFYNLTIYNNPGLGIGSWKRTAGTIIENCLIYNNGFLLKNGKGGGEGIYVQNKSDQIRFIKNNIIFNNYYKGIEAWSAGKRADFEFVKNITLDGNIIFNSGSPSGTSRDNVIIASNDQNGINCARNIVLKNNVLFHNTHNENGKLIGDAPSVTFGFIKQAPIRDVVVKDNIIFGGNNAVRFSIAKSISFINNTVYGAMFVGPKTSGFIKDWDFGKNTFFAKNETLFRISRGSNHTLTSWQDTYGLDLDSKYINHRDVDIPQVLHLSQNDHDKRKFQLALFDAEGNDVVVDFSSESVAVGQIYTIYDVENRDDILMTGVVPHDFKISVPMNSAIYKKPKHNDKAIKTSSNFGVYIIKFETPQNQEIVIEEKESALERFFKWLGF